MHNISKDYESGLTFRELMKKYDKGHTSIRKILINDGVRIRPSTEQKTSSSNRIMAISTHAIFNKADLSFGDEIAGLYKSGMSCVRLANKFDIGRSTVNKILKNRNIRVRTRPIITDFPMIDIVRDYQSGMSLNKLAKKYKRGKKTLRNILIEAKVYHG